MPKDNCKYWDKCYQRNEYHLNKYNHPNKISKNDQLNQNTSQARDKNEPTDNVASNQEESKDLFETKKLRDEVLAKMSGRDYMKEMEIQIELSEKREYTNLCASNDFLRHKFLVEMPSDFYAFWDFVTHLKNDCNNENALKFMKEEYQLLLVGPFDFMAGRFHNAKIMEPGDYLRHWRFFYDPPEFQTVFILSGSGIHYGYWRDSPSDKRDLLVARNNPAEGCEFQFVASNLFDAFLYFLNKDFKSTPFTLSRVASMKNAVQVYIESNNVETIKLETLTASRNKKVVAKGFHRAGIVVALDSKSKVGYRPPALSDDELKKILKSLKEFTGDVDIKRSVMEKLQPAINAANIANDECDFGAALELGINLFSSGYTELHSLVASLLYPTYSLLGRPQYVAILKSHLENRKVGTMLSTLDEESITQEN